MGSSNNGKNDCLNKNLNDCFDKRLMKERKRRREEEKTREKDKAGAFPNRKVCHLRSRPLLISDYSAV